MKCPNCKAELISFNDEIGILPGDDSVEIRTACRMCGKCYVGEVHFPEDFTEDKEIEEAMKGHDWG